MSASRRLRESRIRPPTISEANNLVVNSGSFASLKDLLISCIKFCVSYVVHDGVIEKDWSLRYDADLCSETKTGEVNG